MDEINDDRIADAVEQQLRFLRGEGPEPDLGNLALSERSEVVAILDLVDALAGSAPPSPSLEEDRVAIALGLVPARPDRSVDETDPVMLSVRELTFRFRDGVAIEEPALGLGDSLDGGRPVVVCRSLVEFVLVVVREATDDLETAAAARRLFERDPEISAIAFTGDDGTRSTVVTYSRSVDCLVPARGWAQPGTLEWEPLAIALTRHFERSMPRWDEIASLPHGDLLDDLSLDAGEIVLAQLGHVGKTRPQLPHKRQARDFVASVDPELLVSWVDAIRGRRASGDEVVSQAAALCRSAKS